MTHRDLASDSCAQFLAFAEDWLISPGARPVCHQLREAGHQSVWSPSCQDQVAGGHTGEGVVSLGGAPLSLPSFVSAQFKEFFRLDRVFRTILWERRSGTSFCCLWLSGAEEDADQLLPTDKLLQAVLAEA